MPKYVILTADGEVTEKEAESLDTKEVYDLLGDFEQLPSHPDLTVLASENIHDDMGFNWAATRLVQNFLMPTDRVFGTVVVLGKADGKGDPTDVPHATVQTLQEWYEHRK